MNAMVVIPTYNEADNIESLVQKVLSQPVGVHVLIVDDNSPDGTGRSPTGWRRSRAGASLSCTVPARAAWAVRILPGSPGRWNAVMRP